MDNVHSIHGEKLGSRHPLFNGELREKVREVVGEEGVQSVETAICEHLILKLRELGTLIGTSLANKIFSKVG